MDGLFIIKSQRLANIASAVQCHRDKKTGLTGLYSKDTVSDKLQDTTERT